MGCIFNYKIKEIIWNIKKLRLLEWIFAVGVVYFIKKSIYYWYKSAIFKCIKHKVTIHSFQLLIVTAFAHSKLPAARRKCLRNLLYWVVNAQLMRISTVNSKSINAKTVQRVYQLGWAVNQKRLIQPIERWNAACEKSRRSEHKWKAVVENEKKNPIYLFFVYISWFYNWFILLGNLCILSKFYSKYNTN